MKSRGIGQARAERSSGLLSRINIETSAVRDPAKACECHHSLSNTLLPGAMFQKIASDYATEMN
jgi:hypothetical protein